MTRRRLMVLEVDSHWEPTEQNLRALALAGGLAITPSTSFLVGQTLAQPDSTDASEPPTPDEPKSEGSKSSAADEGVVNILNAYYHIGNGGINWDLEEQVTEYGRRHTIKASLSHMGVDAEFSIPVHQGTAYVLEEMAKLIRARTQDPDYLSPIRYEITSPVPGVRVGHFSRFEVPSPQRMTGLSSVHAAPYGHNSEAARGCSSGCCCDQPQNEAQQNESHRKD